MHDCITDLVVERNFYSIFFYKENSYNWVDGITRMSRERCLVMYFCDVCWSRVLDFYFCFCFSFPSSSCSAQFKWLVHNAGAFAIPSSEELKVRHILYYSCPFLVTRVFQFNQFPQIQSHQQIRWSSDMQEKQWQNYTSKLPIEVWTNLLFSFSCLSVVERVQWFV